MKFRSLSKKQSLLTSLVVSLLLILLIGILDYTTGYEFGISLFYLIPVSISLWFAGNLAGGIISVLSALVWLMADVSAGKTHVYMAVNYWNAFIRLGFFLTVILILSSLKRSLEREKELARTDNLTGAVNSRIFMSTLKMEIARTHRSRAPFTLSYIDIDHFKTINDRLGHSTGDAALKTVAAIMRNNLRETDVLGRLGGDEFAILFPGLGSDDAQVAIPKIRSQLLDEMKKYDWPVTFSIGVLTINRARHSVEDYIKKADDLMYTVKKQGKNSIRYASVSCEEDAEQKTRSKLNEGKK